LISRALGEPVYDLHTPTRRFMTRMPADRSRTKRGHRSNSSVQKTEVVINVYDLLPPGRIATVLWTIGTGVFHSGVVVNGREYAYGWHDRRGVTGVYWTRPRTEPPGGTFRCEILHGFSLATPQEIETILRECSQEFLGTGYHLLTRNCNHFTSALCRRLTGNAGPGWLNRAASIGVALPCVVPRQWLSPPDSETMDGELLRQAGASPGPVDRPGNASPQGSDTPRSNSPAGSVGEQDRMLPARDSPKRLLDRERERPAQATNNTPR
jgi:hypothetical protein